MRGLAVHRTVVRSRVARAIAFLMVAALAGACAADAGGAPDWSAGVPGVPAALLGPCDPLSTNKVACENTKPGSPNWTVSPIDDTIVGFTTDISYVAGNTVNFKVKTDAKSYQINIYRLGYYGGVGARLISSVTGGTAQIQPACIATDTATGLVDCGNWAVSTSWTVPSGAVSGIYYAVLHRNDTGGESEVAFVVRDDAGHSDILFQTSDATWQAYNAYGGNSLYSGTGPGNGGSAYKVSYNRPILAGGSENFIFNAEYPMLKFLEANGYDVSYTTDVDTARRGNLITNHKVFMPVGHDEYWSNEQRSSVETARAAGVNMAFLTGNDMFWKTRWENSTDASSTSWRTLVCYKETKANAKIDPSSQWTGTWRDPRFSPPSDGGRPENAVLGQIFTVNGYRSDSLSVPAAYGKMRLWRNTPLASLAPNTSYTFQPGTLGYEWDSVEDNGFQPPGVAQLSRTSVTMSGNYVLQNYGDLYGPGTKTHALTLYKYQPSGALVFAAGTVQWAWGVEDEHLFQTATPTSDVRMKQATVNLLADMGVQPVTLQTGLVSATSSTNMMPPTVSMDPTQSPIVGTAYTFSGTVNSALGQMAGVEVSVDGGSTWHPANWQASGTTWNYTFTPRSSGARTLEVRATDDSANLSQPVTRAVTVNARTCPCGIWNETTVPTNPSTNDSSALELGVKFQASASGYIQAVKFYKGTGNTGTHTGSLWSASGQLIATGTFTGETATGWQSVTFPTGVAITAGTTYIASYHTDTGHYAGDTNYFTNSSDGLEPLTALQGSSTSPNGVYKLGASGFPTSSYQNTNYWVDVRFGYDPGPGLPPQVVSTNPVNGQTSVSLVAAPSVTFTKPLSPSSLKFTLSGPAGNVPGTAALSTDGTVATFTPSQSLTAGTQYTASISAYDQYGNALPNAPYTWSFTTGNTRPANCPCTIWDDFAAPAVATVNDPAAVEVGTKVRFDNSGQVVGVRFYKGMGNTGTHVGSLWSSTGTRLASGTFTGESAAGWQTLTFSTPVSVQANTTYVVSYYAPNGGYSATNGYFANGGADFGTLHALPNGVDGPNGVYRYGASGFPTSSYNSTNYWVDVMWQADATSTPPSVVSTSPVSGATNVALNAPVSATFNKPVNLSSAQFSLADPGGAKLNGTLSLSSDGKTVTWTAAAPLAAGTTYAASIRIADTSGNMMPTPTTWSFTATATQTCPCSLFSAATVPTVTSSTDTGSFELGVRFTTSVNGSITGVKFYKGAGNTGTHTGSLWTVNGQLLATGTFSGETATGWQTLTFATPVAVQAGVSYIASYTTTTGHYAADAGYFQRASVTSPPLSAPATATGAPNGVYTTGSGFPTTTFQGANYWVDVVFK